MGAKTANLPVSQHMLDATRNRVASGLRVTITGSDAPGTISATYDDPGLFGPDSVTWVVHRDAAMLIGGIRALFYQVLHPLAMAGVADHSDYRHDPLGRLRRTAAFVGTTTFGTTSEATNAIHSVRRIHERVSGTAPNGTHYRANDPHLLGWVHATEVDSFLSAHQAYGSNHLADDEADQYVAEMAAVARLLGVLDPPTTVVELEATLASYEPELHVGRQARSAVRFLLLPDLPAVARAPYGVLSAAALQLLPRDARRRLRIPTIPIVGEPLVRVSSTTLIRFIGWALQEAPS